jgi:hypothetical protein
VKVFGDPPRTAEIVFDETWVVTAVGVVPVLCFAGVAVVPVLCFAGVVVPVLCVVGVGEIVDDVPVLPQEQSKKMMMSKPNPRDNTVFFS